MIFNSNEIADVFIIIAIVLGSLIIILSVGWCVWRLLRPKLVPEKSGAFKDEAALGNPNLDAVSALSKISKSQWNQRAANNFDGRPIVIEHGQAGEVMIKNPSVMSKSEYRQNPGEFAIKKYDENVGTPLVTM
jgi:hypothetical protein